MSNQGRTITNEDRCVSEILDSVFDGSDLALEMALSDAIRKDPRPRATHPLEQPSELLLSRIQPKPGRWGFASPSPGGAGR